MRRLEYILGMNLGYDFLDLNNSWPNTRQNTWPKWLGKNLGNRMLVNSLPTWLMLGMESHSRDLGMNSHSFLLILSRPKVTVTAGAYRV